MSPEAPQALRVDGCPDAEQLAAYIDGALTPAERAVVETHLAECDECRDIVAEATLTRPVAPAKPATFPRRAWITGSGLLAAAAAIFLVLSLQQPDAYYIPEMEGLVRAVGTTRPVESRLTGGFEYGAPPPTFRGDPSTSRSSLQVLSAAASIEQRAKNNTAAGRAALGVAQLIIGDASASSTLEDAASKAPADPRIKSDLAAAYLTAGRKTDDARILAKALESAEQAVTLSPRSPEALFNRALALESLGLVERARSAWDAYLEVDASSPWADEARRRRSALR